MKDDLYDTFLIKDGFTYHFCYFQEKSGRITFRMLDIIHHQPWCIDNLPHTVIIPCSQIGASYCVPDLVCEWIEKHLHGRWSIGHHTNDSFIFYFDSPRNAMLFKLRWS
jgi:hypothetical protein